MLHFSAAVWIKPIGLTEGLGVAEKGKRPLASMARDASLEAAPEHGKDDQGAWPDDYEGELRHCQMRIGFTESQSTEA